MNIQPLNSLPRVAVSYSTLQYITFNVGVELYGIEIKCVEQIIMPPPITLVPRTPKYFLGISNLRGDVISIIDLRERFGIEKEESISQRVIVILTKGVKLGMLVDAVISIYTMDQNRVLSAPPLLVQKNQKYVSGSYQINDTDLLLLLDHEEIVTAADFQSRLIIEQNSLDYDISTEVEEEIFPEVHLVGFSIGLEFYALEGITVEEIIEMPKITNVPEMRDFIEGIFQLREEVIPLLKLADRLNLKHELSYEDSLVIIVKISGVKVGLIVEEITEVFTVYENDIVTPPNNMNKIQAKQLRGIIKLKIEDGNRFIMLLNQDAFFEKEEKKQLIQFDKRIGAQKKQEVVEEEILILKFVIKGELYTIRVSVANEIIPFKTIVPVPKAPNFVKGVINLRGTVISVINLPALINETESPVTKATKILIVQPREEVVGIIVDDLVGIKRVKLSEFEKPSKFLQQKGNLFIEAIGKEKNGDIIVLMDIEKTLIQAQSYSEELNLISSTEERPFSGSVTIDVSNYVDFSEENKGKKSASTYDKKETESLEFLEKEIRKLE